MTPPSGRRRATNSAGSKPLESGRTCCWTLWADAVDRDRRHGRHVAENLGAGRIEHGHVIEATDIAGQTQFERPAELLLAVAFAPGRLVDEHGPHPLHLRLETCR